MARVVLLGDRSTPFTEKVVRGLALKKIDYELVVPKSRAEIRAWNPTTRRIPVLELDGKRIPESGVILQRLDQRFPEPPFLSADPRLAATQRRLHDWADEMLLFYWVWWLRALERSGQGRTGATGRPGAARRPAGLGARLRRALARRGKTSDPGARQPETIVRELGERLRDLENFLGERPFFHAEEPGLADLSVYAGLHTIRLGTMQGGPELIAARSSLRRFMERLEERTGGPVPASELPPGGRSAWLDTE